MKTTVDVKIVKNNPIRFRRIPFPGSRGYWSARLKRASSVRPTREAAVARRRNPSPKKTWRWRYWALSLLGAQGNKKMQRPRMSWEAIMTMVVRPSQEWRLNRWGMGGWARLWDSQTDQIPGTLTDTDINIVTLCRALLVLLRPDHYARVKTWYHTLTSREWLCIWLTPLPGGWWMLSWGEDARRTVSPGQSSRWSLHHSGSSRRVLIWEQRLRTLWWWWGGAGAALTYLYSLIFCNLALSRVCDHRNLQHFHMSNVTIIQLLDLFPKEVLNVWELTEMVFIMTRKQL